MNVYAIVGIFQKEMARTFRTLIQSLISPVISTALYFVIFGLLSRKMDTILGVSIKDFIVPGLIVLTVSTQSVSNASFGIFFPKLVNTFYQYLVAPISFLDLLLGFVGAAACKSLLIGIVILLTAIVMVDVQIMYPLLMLLYLTLVCICFCLVGFIIGIWGRSFEQLNFVPLLVLTPLVFLGGCFYSIEMLPPTWEFISRLNPMFYIVDGFRWTFFGTSEASISLSVSVSIGLCILSLLVIRWMFITGYRLKD